MKWKVVGFIAGQLLLVIEEKNKWPFDGSDERGGEL